MARGGAACVAVSPGGRQSNNGLGNGIARIYWTVFSGPGGIPHQAFRTTFTALGLLTALLGALMCWQQRHLKRLLAFSTISHVGLFLIAVALLTPDGATGTAVYVAAHGLVKAALFARTGVLLDRYGSVDEHGPHGKARDLRTVGVLFVAGALALAGMPPFGTGLGKALSEDAAAGGSRGCPPCSSPPPPSPAPPLSARPCGSSSASAPPRAVDRTRTRPPARARNPRSVPRSAPCRAP
ncbi:proton-conducting transporter transmembrane domain-containing protein [Kitasatospora sp. NPDC054768]